MNKQTNQKNSVWKCECANCGDKRSVEVPQELTPRYCTQCGIEAEYHEVTGDEVETVDVWGVNVPETTIDGKVLVDIKRNCSVDLLDIEENKNKLHQLITEDLLDTLTQIAVLSVDEYPSSQHRIKESLKNIIVAEIELAWATAKLLKK